MPAQLHKVIYKPDTQSTEEYMLIVSREDYNKWREGDTSIPLSQVVECNVQGNQGKLGKASKQQLETVFGTSRDDDVVKFILEKGTMQGSSEIGGVGIDKLRHGSLVDTRGSGGGLHGH
ncbi:DUF1960-domain-containing protein [Ramaria rubella]|nr:DUF1960-domain-containing protein [Ramaria rubella]